MVLVSIFGTSLSNDDFWSALILVLALGGIIVTCYIARTGRYEDVVATLFVIFVIGGILKHIL